MGTIPFRALALLIGSLVLGGACDGDRGPGGPLGSTSKQQAGSPCSVPEECQFPLSCDATRRICVCTSDASCPGDQKCNQFTGTCMDEVPGCSESSPCASDQWCDLATRVCSPLRPFCGPCGRNEDCGGENRCIRGTDGRRFCGRACVADGDCPGGTKCKSGQCTPDNGCASLAKCTPDTLQPCKATAECAADQICEPAMGACVARQSGCPPGYACKPDRECVAACMSDEGCGVGEHCVNALCRQKDSCRTDGTCSTAGKVCRVDPVSGDRECVPTCRSTADCPVGEICEAVRGEWACRPGCKADADCPPDARCNGKTCDRSPGRCQIADVCGACEECRDGRCRFAFDDAFPNRRYCAPCASTGPDADCGLGGFCIDGRCAPPCPEDGCPKGFICQTLADAGGAAYGQGCFPVDGRCDTECL